MKASRLISFFIILHFNLFVFIDANTIEKDVLAVKNEAIPSIGDLDLQEETLIDSSRDSSLFQYHLLSKGARVYSTKS